MATKCKSVILKRIEMIVQTQVVPLYYAITVDTPEQLCHRIQESNKARSASLPSSGDILSTNGDDQSRILEQAYHRKFR